MTADEARKKGYKAVTFAYEAGEQSLMKKVQDDLDRGNIDHVIVDVEEGQEVWRK